MPTFGDLLQLETRNDVGANDLTFARRLIASSETLLELEEALMPFGEGPSLGWNRHGP